MKFSDRLGYLALALAFASSSLGAQQVTVNVGGASAAHPVAAAFQRVRLLVTGPDGWVSEQNLDGASANTFQIDARQLPDGHYNYRLDFTAGGAAVAADSRLPVDANGRALSVRPGSVAPEAKFNSFLIRNGQVLFPKSPTHGGRQDLPGSTVPSQAKDQVIADDLIVQSSVCAGTDCVINESFGFDTIRVKENNTRFKFEDTSLGLFATSDWQLTANDSASGGQERFSIEDITAAVIPFTVEGGAQTDSIYIDSTGRIGFRTPTPALDLHVTTGNTPGQRLEQTAAGGFTAQTWDVGGNEANFFVRDLTGGSQLPFRIRPGAPTSSIDINAAGHVGFGTAAPTASLHINRAVGVAAPVTVLRVTNTNHAQGSRFDVDSNGNVSARGTISQLSSRSAKEGFQAIDDDALLATVDALPIGTWRYLAAPDRHLGPVAEDFHQAFGLGNTDKMIAPSDLAGVALAAVKALQHKVQQRDVLILALERRLAALEAQRTH